MNNLEYVRKCMRIKRTPNDAGTKLTIEFTYYDNGFVSINGCRTMVGVYSFRHADDRGIQKLHQQIKN